MSPGRCFVSSLGEMMSNTIGASGINPPSAGVEGGVGGAPGVPEDAAPLQKRQAGHNECHK